MRCAFNFPDWLNSPSPLPIVNDWTLFSNFNTLYSYLQSWCCGRVLTSQGFDSNIDRIFFKILFQLPFGKNLQFRKNVYLIYRLKYKEAENRIPRRFPKYLLRKTKCELVFLIETVELLCNENLCLSRC